jgi:hypothetical protein
MRALAIIFAVAALACGLTAAHYWYRSIVEIRLDSDFEPVVEELHNRVWFSAAMKAASESARLNRIAALWTAAAVILGTASSIFGSLIGCVDHGQATSPTEAIAAELTVPERVLLFCPASDTNWVMRPPRGGAPWAGLARPVLGLFRLVLPRGCRPDDRHHSANPLSSRGHSSTSCH